MGIQILDQFYIQILNGLVNLYFHCIFRLKTQYHSYRHKVQKWVNLHMACIYGSGKNWLAFRLVLGNWQLSSGVEQGTGLGSRSWARNWSPKELGWFVRFVSFVWVEGPNLLNQIRAKAMSRSCLKDPIQIDKVLMYVSCRSQTISKGSSTLGWYGLELVNSLDTSAGLDSLVMSRSSRMLIKTEEFKRI